MIQATIMIIDTDKDDDLVTIRLNLINCFYLMFYTTSYYLFYTNVVLCVFVVFVCLKQRLFIVSKIIHAIARVISKIVFVLVELNMNRTIPKIYDKHSTNTISVSPDRIL